jgi:hypothetical protein
MLHEYHVIYSVRYYPRFHITAVDLGTYYPWIREHYCTLFPVSLLPEQIHSSEKHSELCYVQNLFQKVCSFSLTIPNSESYQTGNVEALSAGEQMKVGVWYALPLLQQTAVM